VRDARPSGRASLFVGFERNKQERNAGVSPLRFASVEMTKAFTQVEKMKAFASVEMTKAFTQVEKMKAFASGRDDESLHSG
jgi:hypothetical protein